MSSAWAVCRLRFREKLEVTPAFFQLSEYPPHITEWDQNIGIENIGISKKGLVLLCPYGRQDLAMGLAWARTVF